MMSWVKTFSLKLKEIGLIIILWFCGVVLYQTVIYYSFLELAPDRLDTISFYMQALLISVIIGILNGITEVFILKNRFSDTPFYLTVILKTFLFSLTFALTVVIYIFIKNFFFLDTSVIANILNFFSTNEFLMHGSYAILISFAINFNLQIKRKMGKGVLFNLFIGRYHKPRVEERIIMFLDLTSASAIAEKLDPYQYSSFLKTFFLDLDEVITNNKGAVFQFVGDEVVILWDRRNGVEENNCLEFFFAAKNKINSLHNKYLQQFGVVPEFKAGMHYGKIVVTEVGGTKQEIAYHGDTINTAARIRSVCQDFNSSFIISAELLAIFTNIDSVFEIKSIGILNLKGKKNVVGLFSVDKPKVIEKLLV